MSKINLTLQNQKQGLHPKCNWEQETNFQQNNLLRFTGIHFLKDFLGIQRCTRSSKNDVSGSVASRDSQGMKWLWFRLVQIPFWNMCHCWSVLVKRDNLQSTFLYRCGVRRRRHDTKNTATKITKILNKRCTNETATSGTFLQKYAAKCKRCLVQRC